MKKIIIITLSTILLFFSFVVIETIVLASQNDFLSLNQSASNTINNFDEFYKESSDYFQYKSKHTQVFPNQKRIEILGRNFISSEGDHEVLPQFEGKTNVLLTDDSGSVTWEVFVEEKGFYNLNLNYFPFQGKSSMIERSLYINGEVPFISARNLTFRRVWSNASSIVEDMFGNDIRPSQIEKPIWQGALFKDSIGYVTEPYAFYFNEGKNTITLESVREPMVIHSIQLLSVEELLSYHDFKKVYEDRNYSFAETDIKLIQAEDALYTSSPTIYPLNDRTSPLTMPSDPRLIKLNTIGGNNWRVAGDSITWGIEVEETGLYQISLRVKQKIAAGMSVGRNIYIDGVIPFKELQNYAFRHSNNWRIQTLGTQEEPFYFYFEAGKTHTLSMEVSLGSYGPIISSIQQSISELNKLYREILIYTGPEPDQFRDYQLTERVNNLLGRLETSRKNLKDVREAIIDISGSRSDKTGILDSVLLQLDEFIEKPREIHKNLLNYNANISSLGTLIILLDAQPLEIDYFIIHQDGDKLPQSQDSLIQRLSYNFVAFVSTFFTDYSAVGKTSQSDVDETIEVWLSVGKDQANILRKLIDESFTPRTGIQVDLKLVNGAVLLPATLSGVGPDVAMGVGNNVPVNYALRNAAYDLSQFSDFEDITKRFKESAMVPYETSGGFYALPEQQIFMMMFYRTDIFEELGLTPPNTWEDVITLIPDLQKSNLEFFLPVPTTQGAVVDLPPNPIFSSMFFQNDGNFYIDNNRQSGFNEGLGAMVFERWTQFYTDYSFPVEANFVNRFRSGQMPIGISYYNTYNTLSVFAPEIRGRWDFIPIPGTLAYNENNEPYIRRDTVSTGTGVMIMDQSDKKDDAWEYLKWWTSTETQVKFGREMEGILGAAARYPTANLEAMSQLPWTVNQFLKLNEQWDWVQGIPEVPGAYMTGRHLDNAFRLVLEDSANPRETIYDFVQIINAEISKKRREFGLD